MRTPLLVTRGDSHAWDGLCVAQALYCLGQIEAADIEAIEARSGRPANHPDLAQGYLRVALEYGLQVRSINPIDYQVVRAHDSIAGAHLLQAWATLGYPEEEFGHYVTFALGDMRTTGYYQEQYLREYRDTFHLEHRPATAEDLAATLRQGGVARIHCYTEEAYLAVPDTANPDSCWLYDCLMGTSQQVLVSAVMQQPNVCAILDCFTLPKQ